MPTSKLRPFEVLRFRSGVKLDQISCRKKSFSLKINFGLSGAEWWQQFLNIDGFVREILIQSATRTSNMRNVSNFFFAWLSMNRSNLLPELTGFSKNQF